MMLTTFLKRTFAVAILSSVTIAAFAQEAPVFDVDNYPPQFDGQPDAGASNAAASRASVPSFSQDDLPAISSQQASLSPDQRLARLEQQITNMQHADSAQKLSALQSEVQTLRGLVENLTHQLQEMQTQQRSMYSDLDKRLTKQSSAIAVASNNDKTIQPDDATTSPVIKPKKLSAKSKAMVTPASVPQADEPPVEDQPVIPAKTTTITKAGDAATQPAAKMDSNAEQEELKMYQKAYDLIKDSKFDQAINVLQSMLKKYPSGQSAANAHYWLGQLYGLQKNREQAAIEFSTVIKNYPDSPKVSDAQVNLGMIYAAQFKWSEAKATFKKVMSRYPGTTSARLAAQQLKEIKSEGH